MALLNMLRRAAQLIGGVALLLLSAELGQHAATYALLSDSHDTAVSAGARVWESPAVAVDEAPVDEAAAQPVVVAGPAAAAEQSDAEAPDPSTNGLRPNSPLAEDQPEVQSVESPEPEVASLPTGPDCAVSSAAPGGDDAGEPIEADDGCIDTEVASGEPDDVIAASGAVALDCDADLADGDSSGCSAGSGEDG